MASRVIRLFKGRRGNNGPAAAPAQQQPAEPEQLQPLQDDAAKDRTQEREPARGPFRRAAKALRRLLRLPRRQTRGTATEGTAQPDSGPEELRAEAAASTAASEPAAASEQATAEGRVEADMALTEGMAPSDSQAQGMPATEAMPTLTETPAPALEIFQNAAVSPQQVLATVRDILERLASCATVDAGLKMEILSLAEEHPAQVAMSLLSCAPTCDRATALMWRAIGTSEVAVEEVLPALLSALEEEPPYGGFYCCGDNEAVFGLAATLVLWRIAPMSEWHSAVANHSPQLFVALLLQIVTMTEQTAEDAETRSFWRACQEEHGLPGNPSSFAAQTMKALLSRVGYAWKLADLEHMRVWQKLLCADTQHYAAALLAREVRCAAMPFRSFCPCMASHLLGLLVGKQPRCPLPALAFFVELLPCLDLSKDGPRALLVLSRQLPSECRDRPRLALRGLVVLSKEPSLGRGIRGLYPHLVQQLADPDAEMVGMTLCVLTRVLQDKDLVLPSVIALKLAEPLPPHFENDNSHVQLLSIRLFGKVTELVVEEGENPLTTIVSQSLLPLFLRWHDENLHVSKASGEALLYAARFLRRRDLEELLRKEQRMKFAERLLLQDESRAAEHLRWALPYLQSPQRPVRRAAVRIIGLAGVLVTGQKEELQVLTEALQALRGDESLSCTSILIQLIFERRSAELGLSAGSDVPASFGDFQFLLKKGAPAEQDGPAGAPGTALAAQS
ncbi:maestro heat-like repeat-containing protein family member 6 [Haemorhous mexicanus]|uniref:maestro heat-like repeat-containing protein family member 6 n=1 Tax=Haemorhous mexicanus TaxID=30427 RepID=UPI0028BDD68A|nr:maestro heat-like repeat-containing protein family member 6 [Haemorhous mexicanus]